MADKKKDKSKVSDKFKRGEEGYEAILDDEDYEDTEGFLDDGLTPEEIFDPAGLGVTAPDRELPTIDMDLPGLPPSRGTNRGQEPIRRAGSSPGSVLSRSEKTQGYTPSEGETFTFDRTGQMMVPEGRRVEDFAPGVRKHLDRLDRRGADPRGSRPPARTTTGSTPSKSPISSKFYPSVPPRNTLPEPPMSPARVDSRFAGQEPTAPASDMEAIDSRYGNGLPPDSRESDLEEAAKPPIDDRYQEDSGLEEFLGRPFEAETLGEIPRMEDTTPAQSTGGGGGAPSPWRTPLGKGYESIQQSGVIPQDAKHKVSEGRQRHDIDPGYQGQFDSLLGEMASDKERGYGNILGAITRSFAQGKEDAGTFKGDRDKLLDSYTQGMDKIDRRKFIDAIAGNLGKVISGGIGLGAIPTPGVSASAPLNVAKYYDYKPYDPTGDRAAEKDRYDVGLSIQKEKEASRKEGRESEVKAYEMLEKYRGEMTDKQMAKVMEMLNLTKQAVNLGFENETNSIFEEKFMADLMKMDRDAQMKYVGWAVDVLKSMLGNEAAENVNRNRENRPSYTEVSPPNVERMREIESFIAGLLETTFPRRPTPKGEIIEILKRTESKEMEGNLFTKDVNSSTRLDVYRRLRDLVRELPDNYVMQNPQQFFKEWLSNPEVQLQLGITKGTKTDYEGRDAVRKLPVTPKDIRTDGVHPVPRPGDRKHSMGFDAKTGVMRDNRTGKPVTTREELEEILREDGKHGLKYPDAVFQYVK